MKGIDGMFNQRDKPGLWPTHGKRRGVSGFIHEWEGIEGFYHSREHVIGRYRIFCTVLEANFCNHDKILNPTVPGILRVTMHSLKLFSALTIYNVPFRFLENNYFAHRHYVPTLLPQNCHMLTVGVDLMEIICTVVPYTP